MRAQFHKTRNSYLDRRAICKANIRCKTNFSVQTGYDRVGTLEAWDCACSGAEMCCWIEELVPFVHSGRGCGTVGAGNEMEESLRRPCGLDLGRMQVERAWARRLLS